MLDFDQSAVNKQTFAFKKFIQDNWGLKFSLRLLKTALLVCFPIVGFTTTDYKEKTSVIIGVEAINYCPILCFKNGQNTGLLIELLDKISSRSGITYTIQPYAIQRLKQQFKNGAIDVKFPDNPTWSKSSAEHFSLAIIPYRDAFFSLTNDDSSAKSIINSAAIPAGFYLPKSIRNDIKVIEATSIKTMFNMLQYGRVDAIYLHYLVAQNFARQNGYNIIEREDYPADNNHFHFRSINNPKFLSHINQLIREEPEFLNSLLQKHGLITNIKY